MVQTAGPHIANENTFTNKSSYIHARGFFFNSTAQPFSIAIVHIAEESRGSKFYVWCRYYGAIQYFGCLVGWMFGGWGSIQRMMMILKLCLFQGHCHFGFFCSTLFCSTILLWCSPFYLWLYIYLYVRLYVCKCWFLCWFLAFFMLCFYARFNGH